MKRIPDGQYISKEDLDKFNKSLKLVLILICIVFFSIFVYINTRPMTPEGIESAIQECKSKQGNPLYVFKEKGNKESGVVMIRCDLPKSENKEEGDSLFDDDSPVTATGQPSMSGLSGGPF